MVCKKCGSSNVKVELVAEQQKRGIIKTLFWILLATCTFGIALLIVPALSTKGSKTRKYAVCQDCGHKERI
jgi:hypothetical protein